MWGQFGAQSKPPVRIGECPGRWASGRTTTARTHTLKWAEAHGRSVPGRDVRTTVPRLKSRTTSRIDSSNNSSPFNGETSTVLAKQR